MAEQIRYNQLYDALTPAEQQASQNNQKTQN